MFNVSMIAADPQPAANTITVALITAGAAIAASSLAAIAAYYSARLKSKEIEITYEQRLKDTYLQNARQYINGVYVPINIALRNLSDHFRIFQEAKGRSLTQDAIDYFRDACLEYDRVISELVAQGADSFLTSELDERLQAFNSFLSLSLNAKEPVRREILNVSFRVPLTSWSSQYEIAQNISGKLPKFVRFLRGWHMSVFGLGVSYRSSELLAAPIESPEFEDRMSLEIPRIKLLIKEVTLGTRVGA